MKKTVRAILYLFFSGMVLGLAALIGYWYYTHQPAKRNKKIPENTKAIWHPLPAVSMAFRVVLKIIR